jgi:hypothetical protein
MSRGNIPIQRQKIVSYEAETIMVVPQQLFVAVVPFILNADYVSKKLMGWSNFGLT